MPEKVTPKCPKCDSEKFAVTRNQHDLWLVHCDSCGAVVGAVGSSLDPISDNVMALAKALKKIAEHLEVEVDLDVRRNGQLVTL